VSEVGVLVLAVGPVVAVGCVVVVAPVLTSELEWLLASAGSFPVTNCTSTTPLVAIRVATERPATRPRIALTRRRRAASLAAAVVVVVALVVVVVALAGRRSAEAGWPCGGLSMP
jgi:hypothetical protein